MLPDTGGLPACEVIYGNSRAHDKKLRRSCMSAACIASLEHTCDPEQSACHRAFLATHYICSVHWYPPLHINFRLPTSMHLKQSPAASLVGYPLFRACDDGAGFVLHALACPSRSCMYSRTSALMVGLHPMCGPGHRDLANFSMPVVEPVLMHQRLVASDMLQLVIPHRPATTFWQAFRAALPICSATEPHARPTP